MERIHEAEVIIPLTMLRDHRDASRDGRKPARVGAVEIIASVRDRLTNRWEWWAGILTLSGQVDTRSQDCHGWKALGSPQRRTVRVSNDYAAGADDGFAMPMA
jgi:hypothetical protein